MKTGHRMVLTSRPGASDLAVVERLLKAYRYSIDRLKPDHDTEWHEFLIKHNGASHAAFCAGDAETAWHFLAHPERSKLFYGFDNLFDDMVERVAQPELAGSYQEHSRQRLWRLAEAIGAVPLFNPEQPKPRPSVDVLPLVERALAFSIDTPVVYSGEPGLSTDRGILTDRAVAAMYQAYRLRQMIPAKGTVCEIGGGLGRTALYARAAGLTSYVLVDIPFTAISQGFYLIKALGQEAVTLAGESPRGPIRLMTPDDFLADHGNFDVVLNVDSLPELSPGTARAYAAQIARRAGCFLSINHEAKRMMVRDLMAPHRSMSYQRNAHWMRAGYTEETWTFR